MIDRYLERGHFCYDPLKRVPPRPATLNDKYTSEDFSL